MKREEQGSFDVPAGVKRVVIGFHAISFKTRPGGMKYFYRLETSEVLKTSEVWQGPTTEETVEYFNLKPGKYAFKVQAVDRDLNYSEPASLRMTILPPPFYQTTGFIILLVSGAFLIPTAVYAGILIAQRRRAKVALEFERCAGGQDPSRLAES